MDWEFSPYIIPLLIAAVISLAFAVYAWRRRTVPGATAFLVLVLAIAIWSIGYSLEIVSTDLAAKIFWAKVQYLGIVTVPVAWLTFALQYTQRDAWLNRRNLAILAIVPLITLLLVWTNEAHGLVWSQLSLVATGPFPAMNVSYGLWFWIHSVYSYILLLLGTLLIVRMVGSFPDLYRWQAILLLFGAVVPWLGNALYIFNLTPNLDLTPFAFSLSGVAIGWNLFRFRFFDIVPIARRTVVDSMSDAVIVLDTQNRIVDLNPAAQTILGPDKAKAIGLTSTQALSGWAELLGQYRSQTETRAELTKDQDGTQQHFEVQISLLYDQRQQLAGRLIVLRDITERRQAEEELRRLSRAVEQTPSIVIITDLSGTIEFVNPAFYETTGYCSEEVLGKNPRILKSGLHPPEFYEQMWGTITSDEVWQGELINRKKSGELYWEAATISPIKNRAGKTTHYLAIKEDITARKKTESALKQSKERYRSVIQAANDAIFITSLETGAIIDANAKASVLIGRPISHIIGMQQSELYPPHKAEQHKLAFERSSTDTPGQVLTDMEVLHQDGHTVPVEISESIIKGRDGQKLILGLFRDITKRKKAEEALIHAFNQAVEANQLKTQLLANISHDLRTPINAILGYAEMLQEGIYGPVSDEQRIIYNRILDNTTNLTHMVSQLLDQAQLEAGTLKLAVTSFAPAELIERVESTMKVLAQSKGLQLDCTISPDMPPVLSGDPNRLYQILANLVDNSVKFTEQGAVEVEFYCPDEEHWAMRVSDTGSGIPPEAHSHIFEAFQQIDGTATREHVGSGLGLSIVKQLTTLMDGEVLLESQLGQGSTFTIVLQI